MSSCGWAEKTRDGQGTAPLPSAFGASCAGLTGHLLLKLRRERQPFLLVGGHAFLDGRMLGDGVARRVFVDVEIGIGHEREQLAQARIVGSHLLIELGDATPMMLERGIGAIAGLGFATLLLLGLGSARARSRELH